MWSKMCVNDLGEWWASDTVHQAVSGNKKKTKAYCSPQRRILTGLVYMKYQVIIPDVVCGSVEGHYAVRQRGIFSTSMKKTTCKCGICAGLMHQREKRLPSPYHATQTRCLVWFFFLWEVQGSHTVGTNRHINPKLVGGVVEVWVPVNNNISRWKFIFKLEKKTPFQPLTKKLTCMSLWETATVTHPLWEIEPVIQDHGTCVIVYNTRNIVNITYTVV